MNIMVLVGAAILPHAPVVLDPNSVEVFESASAPSSPPISPLPPRLTSVCISPSSHALLCLPRARRLWKYLRPTPKSLTAYGALFLPLPSLILWASSLSTSLPCRKTNP